MKNDFLLEILGDEGFKALNNAIDRLPLLKSALFPRAVVSWVSTVGKFGYEGGLPGIDNSYFSLIKNQNDTYTGALTINDELYTFEQQDLLHVAASVGVALNLEVEPLDERLQKRDLTKLGNGIDVLVKSQIIKNSDYFQEKQVLPEYNEQIKPLGIPKLKLSKSELVKTCKTCGCKYFTEEDFVGCRCLSDLKKYVKLEKTDKDVYLKFVKKLDHDAIEALVIALKR